MIDVIIECVSKQACDEVIKRISQENGVLKDKLDVVNMLFATIPETKLQEFKSIPGVLNINIDEKVVADEAIAEYQTIMGIDEFRKNVSKGNGVKVGIVDTGVNKDHPSLKPNFIEGHNVVNNTADVSDTYNHGTKTAGIICSVGPDYPGIAPESKIYVAKVYDSNNYASISNVLKGISWCISKNVDIINVSLGSATSCSTYQSMVDLATKNNIIIVASAGMRSSVGAPACTTGVICAGSVRQVGSSFEQYLSCTSSRVDLVALGFALITTSATGGLIGFFATSATASVISGILALLKSANPTLNRQDLINKLYSYCKDLGTAGKDSTFGRGIPILTAETGSFSVSIVSQPAGATVRIV